MRSLKIIKHMTRTSTPTMRPLYIRKTEYKRINWTRFCVLWLGCQSQRGWTLPVSLGTSCHKCSMRICSIQPQFFKDPVIKYRVNNENDGTVLKNHEEGQKCYPRERNGHLVRESHYYHGNLWVVTKTLSK